jgi:hypothetical protein
MQIKVNLLSHLEPVTFWVAFFVDFTTNRRRVSKKLQETEGYNTEQWLW